MSNAGSLGLGKPRVDGIAKVTGGKVYGRDYFHDMAEWNHDGTSWFALIVRATTTQECFAGINWQNAPELLRDPVLGKVTTICQDNLEREKIKGLPSFSEKWLVPVGERATFLGQPVAIILFENPNQLRDVSEWMRLCLGNHKPSLATFKDPQPSSDENDVRRLSNPLMAPVERESKQTYGRTCYIRHEVGSKDDFSEARFKGHHPDDTHLEAIISSLTKQSPQKSPDEIKQDADERLKKNKSARDAQQRILHDIADNGWEVLDRTFFTQSTDTMFMEPEAGLAWVERTGEAQPILHILLGTQSPAKDIRNLNNVFKFAQNRPAISLEPKYPGGGFGGRDESTFPIYLAIAAWFADGPVRLAFDRYEQFWIGIKRHAAVIHNRVAYDKSGQLHALFSDITMDGGGEKNLTNAVTSLAALHAAGPYRIPRTAIKSVGLKTIGAPAGSMRGFGIPQATFAIESMMDEIATKCGLDPINVRLENVLKQGEKDVTGLPLDHHLANEAICHKAKAHPLWANRIEDKKQRDQDHLKYGVGFACCMEAYGTTKDATPIAVELNDKGQIIVHSAAVDMGQGSATSLAITTRPILGADAHHVEMGVTDFETRLNISEDKAQGKIYTPKISNAMSASMTAFFHIHALEEASKLLFRFGILEAAKRLWNTANVDTATFQPDGRLSMAGYKDLTLEELAACARQEGLVTGVMVHTYFQVEFAEAGFALEVGTDRVDFSALIDALAVKRGSADFVVVPRLRDPEYPDPDSAIGIYKRSVYASVGHLVAVEVNTRSGAIKVLDAVTFLDAGDIHHQGLLRGQVEGGLIMGLGMALCEDIPPAPEGVDGLWNLHRYQIPRASHMPVAWLKGTEDKLVTIDLDQESILSHGPKVRKKGVAEATMTTVPAAVANAVAHATNLRINTLPLTRARMLEAINS